MPSRAAILFCVALLAIGASGPLLAGTVPCESGVNNECTTAPTCQADGSCGGEPAREGLPCTQDITGGCMTNPVCQSGVCLGTVEAPDGTACTQDISGGCMMNPVCQGGVCLGTVAAPTGTACSVPGLEKCFTAQCLSPAPGFSVCLPGAPRTCPPASDPCKQGVCNPQTGDCVEGDKCLTFFGCEVCDAGTCRAVNTGGACANPEGDFNPCTTNDHCVLLGTADALSEAVASTHLPPGLVAGISDAQQVGVRSLCMGDAGGSQPTATPTTVTPPTPTVGPTACLGDCNDDGEVTVNELITMVNIALGNAQVSACPRGDADGSGDITINEIVSAVNRALNGCGG